MPSAGGYPTILRWYGAKIEKEAGCPICGNSLGLETCEGVNLEGLEGVVLDEI